MLYRLAPLLVIAVTSGPAIGTRQAPDLSRYLMADRAAEIALARSAAPKSISDSATVLVLTRTGYVEAAKGTNGFTCFVQHSYDAPISTPNFWDPNILGPQCLNPAAVRTVLVEMRKHAEWIMAGVAPREVMARTKRAYASGELPKPAPGAMAYMLSPKQRLSTTHTSWVPHVMFFYDRSVASASFGVDGVASTIIDGSAGDPDAPYITMLIPVRRWADGTLAMPAAGH